MAARRRGDITHEVRRVYIAYIVCCVHRCLGEWFSGSVCACASVVTRFNLINEQVRVHMIHVLCIILWYGLTPYALPTNPMLTHSTHMHVQSTLHQHLRRIRWVVGAPRRLWTVLSSRKGGGSCEVRGRRICRLACGCVDGAASSARERVLSV